MSLSDFQAALEYYKPTAVQAEHFHHAQPATDPMAAVASFMHQFSQHTYDSSAYASNSDKVFDDSSPGPDNHNGAEGA